MKVDYPGLLVEPLANGVRYRVRPRGDKKRRIRIYCGPEHEDFQRQYLAARAGEQPEPLKAASEYAKPKSIGWLVNSYIEYFQTQVKNGHSSAKTLKKKRNLFAKLLKTPDKEMLIPREKLISLRDDMSATPAQADAFIKAIRVMYDWAIERGMMKTNTAINIGRIYKSKGGTIPWTADDVETFFVTHKPGTKAHAALTILAWSACRIEDLTILGRPNECLIDGVEALKWTPLKKGSTEVKIPLAPAIKDATRALKVQGQTYILGRGGKPFSSGDSMSAMFKRWCVEAGLENLSAHGVRKGIAEILAEHGCTPYEIAAILGHSDTKTSEVYTKGFERWSLSKGAFARVSAAKTLGSRGTPSS